MDILTVKGDIMIGKTLVCHETGKTFIGAIQGISTNYAIDSCGNVFSDEGVNIAEIRELLDRSKPYTAYLDKDANHLTGWKGNILGKVISRSTVKLTRRSWIHGKYMYAVTVKDVHGGLWYGRGSGGVCITLRAYK